MSSTSTSDGLYQYHPSHVLPAVFAALIGISLILHIYQNLWVFAVLPTPRMAKLHVFTDFSVVATSFGQ
jgi:hypothetical protein